MSNQDCEGWYPECNECGCGNLSGGVVCKDCYNKVNERVLREFKLALLAVNPSDKDAIEVIKKIEAGYTARLLSDAAVEAASEQLRINFDFFFREVYSELKREGVIDEYELEQRVSEQAKNETRNLIKAAIKSADNEKKEGIK